MIAEPGAIHLSQIPGKTIKMADPMPRKGHSAQELQIQSMAYLPQPATTANAAQQWNHPRSNIAKVFACNWSFIVMGANDAAYGALISYFCLPPHGVLDYGISPPYPVLVLAFMIAGYGNGLADAAWNAYIGGMANANELLGVLHGLYGFGAVMSPLIATSMITKLGTPWYAFYYLMIGMAGAEVLCVVSSFWTATAAQYKASLSQHSDSAKSGLRAALFKMPAARVTWLCAFYLLCYVGTEVSLGGWIVVFMIQVRGDDEFSSGMTAIGFWLGLAVGRVVLGFLTPRIGERKAISIYLPLAGGLQLVFWLVPQFTVSAVAVGLQGFFIGPLFPAAILAMSKLLPCHLQVGAIGFAAAFGGGGAAILPFAVGALAQAKGVQVLQPIILSFFIMLMILWLCLPNFDKSKI
ncbi:major facilitator superfamily domain-containing protein [Xylariales sp. PMI_506]|nr:major facilitator superfamily domain-containing protein [Xylariales sp. PMI_506]